MDVLHQAKADPGATKFEPFGGGPAECPHKEDNAHVVAQDASHARVDKEQAVHLG